MIISLICVVFVAKQAIILTHATQMDQTIVKILMLRVQQEQSTKTLQIMEVSPTVVVLVVKLATMHAYAAQKSSC
ncbi:15355_t:CDS:2, partial [Cetraspora pellucida]